MNRRICGPRHSHRLAVQRLGSEIKAAQHGPGPLYCPPPPLTATFSPGVLIRATKSGSGRWVKIMASTVHAVPLKSGGSGRPPSAKNSETLDISPWSRSVLPLKRFCFPEYKKSKGTRSEGEFG
jgi:hypothetical protein